MPSLELTHEQIMHLRDVLRQEIEHLSHLVGDSTHPDDEDEQQTKNILCEILELLNRVN
jgi:hypothetical protein